MYDSIFISYRREGSSTFAGILHDTLCRSFPSAGIFKDKNKLHAGKDFKKQIEDAIDRSSIMLVLINKGWAKLTDQQGRKKLFSKEDFIRHEIRTAILKEKHILPVLFEGGQMPDKKDLPADIKKLSDYQAHEIDPDNTVKSINKLVELILSLTTEKLGNTLTGSVIRFRKDPKGTLKNISNITLDLAKRETNAVMGYLNKFLKKKKDKGTN